MIDDEIYDVDAQSKTASIYLHEHGLFTESRLIDALLREKEKLIDQLEAAQKQVEQYRVYDDVIAEIDRRADKEWCLGDQCDFTVTITYEQYLAINAAQSTN